MVRDSDNQYFSNHNSFSNSLNNIEFNDSKSRNLLYLKRNNYSNLSSVLNISNINKNSINNRLNKVKYQTNAHNIKYNENIIRSLQSNESFPEINLNYDIKSIKPKMRLMKDNININLFDFLCYSKNSKKKKIIELFKLGNYFYKKRMDIVNVFTLLIMIEKRIKNKEKLMIYDSKIIL